MFYLCKSQYKKKSVNLNNLTVVIRYYYFCYFLWHVKIICDIFANGESLLEILHGIFVAQSYISEIEKKYLDFNK